LKNCAKFTFCNKSLNSVTIFIAHQYSTATQNGNTERMVG